MLTVHGVTHPGRVRKINEDSWLGDIDLGVFVVADGMGGHNAGEIASKLAIESVRGFLLRTSDSDDCTWPYGIDPTLSFNANRLMTSLKLANHCVFKVGESRDEYTGMGTTAVAVVISHGRLIYSGVGDSRIYSFVEGRLQQRRWETEDGQKRSKHEVVAQTVTFMPKRSEAGGGGGEPPMQDDMTIESEEQHN